MRNLLDQLRAHSLAQYLARIGDEVGAPEGATPQQVLEAAQRLRDALARARGHQDPQEISRTPYRERGW